jgi:hypothetical protein
MRSLLICLRNVGFCDQGNEHSDPLKGRDSIEHVIKLFVSQVVHYSMEVNV